MDSAFWVKMVYTNSNIVPCDDVSDLVYYWLLFGLMGQADQDKAKGDLCEYGQAVFDLSEC